MGPSSWWGVPSLQTPTHTQGPLTSHRCCHSKPHRTATYLILLPGSNFGNISKHFGVSQLQGKGVLGIWWVEVWDATQHPIVFGWPECRLCQGSDTCPRRGASALFWRSWEDVLCLDSLSKTTLAARKRRQSSLESLAQECLRDIQTSPQVPFSQRMPTLRGPEAEGLESAQHLAQRGPENRHRG